MAAGMGGAVVRAAVVRAVLSTVLLPVLLLLLLVIMLIPKEVGSNGTEQSSANCAHRTAGHLMATESTSGTSKESGA